MSQSSPTILYVAGYGRSGSTVLDVLLGSHPDAVSVGEVTFLGRDWGRDERVCACGASYSACSFWGDLFETRTEAASFERATRRCESIRHALPRLLVGLSSGSEKRAYRRWACKLVEYIALRGDANVIVDSSKTAGAAAGRFWALRHVVGLDVRVVHLVRDGRDTLQSMVETGSNWALEGYEDESPLQIERTVFGWLLANGLSYVLGRSLGSDRYLRIRFEDLREDPESVLHEIGTFAGLDLSTVADRAVSGQPVPVGHNVGGNRVRLQDRISLRRTSLEERRPWAGLGLYHRLLFGIFGQWFNRILGYKW